MIWFKSWTNHWWWFDMSTKDLDLISFYDLIWWFEQITTFSKLGQGIMCCWYFYCSWVELLISVIVPSVIFADTLAVRPNVHWWHFAHKTIVWNCCHLVDIVIWFDLWFAHHCRIQQNPKNQLWYTGQIKPNISCVDHGLGRLCQRYYIFMRIILNWPIVVQEYGILTAVCKITHWLYA